MEIVLITLISILDQELVYCYHHLALSNVKLGLAYFAIKQVVHQDPEFHDKHSDSCRTVKDNPLVYSDGALQVLDIDVTSEKKESVRLYHATISHIYLR